MDIGISLIRTAVPYFVGWLLTLALRWGLTIPEDVEADLTGLMTFVLGTLYYTVFRNLEQKHPELGAFLGMATQPKYKETK